MQNATREPRVAEYSCSLEVIVAVLGGKWKPGILFNLIEGPLRFAEIRRKLGVTEKVLTQQLRDLEAHGVVRRKVSGDVPPHVTYSLTRYGRTLRPILELMGQWGEAHLARLRRRAQRGPETPRPGPHHGAGGQITIRALVPAAPPQRQASIKAGAPCGADASRPTPPWPRRRRRASARAG